MIIDVWSDIACPFCYIGKRNLESALEEFGSEEIEVVYHSFQLDPYAKKEGKRNSVEDLANKYGSTLEQAQKMIDNVIAMGKDVGIHYNYDEVISTNTMNAHRLTHYAKKFNKGEEVVEELFKAHFIDGLDVGDIEDLAKIGARVGLDSQEIIKVLKSKEYISEVETDMYLAKQYEIGSVPFFIFNKKYAIQGAQPPVSLVDAMKQSSE